MMIRLLVLFSLGLILTSRAETQDRNSRPELSGEFALEVEEKAEGGYSSTQNQVIGVFKDVVSQLDTLRNLGTANIKTLDDSALQFLTTVYLFCTVNQGTCPVVLDALLELDAIESKFRGVPQCPRLTRFWSLWLKNDMERRQEFLVKTGYLNTSDEFKRNKRGRYIKCKETLERDVDFKQPGPAFFSARYNQGSPQVNALNQMVTLLEKVKANVGNVFDAMEIKVGGKDGEDDGLVSDKDKKKGLKKSTKPGAAPAKKTLR